MPSDQFAYKMYHGEIKLYLNEMIMTTIKKNCTRPTRFIGFVIVLTHLNNCPWIDMSPHSDTLS